MVISLYSLIHNMFVLVLPDKTFSSSEVLLSLSLSLSSVSHDFPVIFLHLLSSALYFLCSASMALSFCSKRPYSSLHNLINPNIISLFPQTQAELGSSFFFDFDVYDEYISLSDSSYSIDSLFDTNNINDCKPQNAFTDDSLDEEIRRHPKRQKTVSENHCRFTYSSATNTTNPEYSNGYVPIPSFSPEFSNFPSEAVLSACWGNQEMIKSEAMKKDSNISATGTTSVSAQSIAAERGGGR